MYFLPFMLMKLYYDFALLLVDYILIPLLNKIFPVNASLHDD